MADSKNHLFSNCYRSLVVVLAVRLGTTNLQPVVSGDGLRRTGRDLAAAEISPSV